MNAKKSITCIGPVNQEEKRPLFSVMIPTYNCAQYLRITLESVLSQDLGPDEMQIEVIDDGSTLDDPESVVNEIGKGRVGFFRNSINLGATQNFNNCLKRSKGKYVHILHGDDFVASTFYSSIKKMIDINSLCGIYVTRTFFVDTDGTIDTVSPKYHLLSPKKEEAVFFAQNLFSGLISFPGVVFNRSCLENTVGFDSQFGHVADLDLFITQIFTNGSYFSNEPLSFYRVHPQNDTSKHKKTGNNIKELFMLQKKLSKMLANFDQNTFVQNLQRISYGQFRSFNSIGDLESASMNYSVWKSITPLYQRVLQNAKVLYRSFVERN